MPQTEHAGPYAGVNLTAEATGQNGNRGQLGSADGGQKNGIHTPTALYGIPRYRESRYRESRLYISLFGHTAWSHK